MRDLTTTGTVRRSEGNQGIAKKGGLVRKEDLAGHEDRDMGYESP